MESGQRTHPTSSTIEVPSTSSKKLGSSLSSASNSSSDSSFELIVNAPSEFFVGTNDPSRKDGLHVAGHSDYEFEFISGDDLETRPDTGLSNAAKTSSRPLSQSSSSASESSLHDHVIEPPKPDKTLPDSGSAGVKASTSNMGMQPGPELGEADNITSRKITRTSSSISSSSSSESESDLKIELHLDGDATNNLFTINKDNRLVADFSDDDAPISSMPSNGQAPVSPTHRIDLSVGSDATTQYPPTQVMERADDPASSSYRIPSRVFSRTKSTAPMEWSVASNESLFSIHMGNMSFTREQLCWLGKSGELCRPGELAMSPLIELSSHQLLGIKPPCDGGLKGTHTDGELVVTEATAAETMREVIRENSENQRKESSTLIESPSQSASLSHHSEGSTKSFQFPILTGDGGKSISLKGGDSSEKPKQQTPPESPQPASNPQTPKESSADESSPKEAANVGPRRWFSCFSCCPFCS